MSLEIRLSHKTFVVLYHFIQRIVTAFRNDATYSNKRPQVVSVLVGLCNLFENVHDYETAVMGNWESVVLLDLQ